MTNDKKICENCGLPRTRTAYIPFEKGLLVCIKCCDEWQHAGKHSRKSQAIERIGGGK